MIRRKKLIEVALPLEAINVASAREKSIRHGHPSTLHLWWARRPLAAARAVIFSQMVDDPSEYVETLLSDGKLRRRAESVLKARSKIWTETTATLKKASRAGIDAPSPGPEPELETIIAEIERERLFVIIRDLVLWENTTNDTVLQRASEEIWQSWRRTCADNADHPRAKELFDRKKLPAFHDPFAGGGALPLEAQRLGLQSFASDLNPVAVIINKAMIEIPPKFNGKPPVNPATHKDANLFARDWKGAQGLAEDIRYYGKFMRDEAEKRIGKLYPKVEVSREMAKGRPDLKQYVGEKLNVIAWLWVRTVRSPNPAFASVHVPLASTFLLSTKPGKEAYIEPVIDNGEYRFTVKIGKPKNSVRAKNGTKLSRGANFECLMSGTPISADHIKAEGKGGRMGARLMGIVAEGARERVYLPPTIEHENAARKAEPKWKPETTISGSTQYLGVKPYGMDRFDQLFTNRQLVALGEFSDLVGIARERIRTDAREAGFTDDGISLRDGGTGSEAYADALATYLSFAVDYAANYWSTLATPAEGFIRGTFSMQALPMTWDFAEAPVFGSTSGSWMSAIEWSAKALETLPARPPGIAQQSDAARQALSTAKIVSTDPPYYDNVPYADLSDYFYVWLRRCLRFVYPDLFATLAVPKVEELVAFAYRHADKSTAEAFFLDGMTEAMHRLGEQAHPAFPVTIYYAFKQTETDDSDGTSSTGWDTFLESVIRANFTIEGTWPMRTERGSRNRSIDSNALASSIILVCRKRDASAPTATRREFIAALKNELPQALANLQRGNIAPVDLAQAAIGPGMAVYTRYSKVLGAEGKPVSVREALALINQTLDEALAEQEGDFDADTRWALAWFEQSGFAEGAYGIAETLSKAKNTSVKGLEEAGILKSSRGNVRLLKPEELSHEWDPVTDSRLTTWESVHHLVRVLESSGERKAAELVAKMGSKAEIARELAYRLYTVCERNKRSVDAQSYNALVQSFPEILRLSREGGMVVAELPGFFANEEA